MAQPKKMLGGLLIFAIILIAIGYFAVKKAPELSATVIDRDTTFAAAAVPAGNLLIKNNATLTITGDVVLNDRISCSNGPLSLVVTGSLTVQGELRCNRNETLAGDDVGNGITIVAGGSITFDNTAVVATNGHVQIAHELTHVAQTKEALDALFEQAASDSGEKFRMGPFIEIPLAPGQVSGAFMENSGKLMATAQKISSRPKLFIATAKAQEPAVDELGNKIENTVKIGGTWVVGDPTQKPPKELQVPTPPKGIDRIIVNFDFGGQNMQIQNFTLFGPDGRAGTDDTGSCNVKGGDGKDAFRLLINASNVTVNNFDLYLGYGGDGGFAETSEDCEDARAQGGNGGKPGNFKINASQGISIVGAFNIHPGQGGRGGQAIAHGKQGEDGCAGEKGGDATATGGKGGDNKKGVKVEGNVSGTSNVTISKIVAGDGGTADAYGGNGGNGIGPGCAGGPGGKATATGGKGGDATSRNFESQGGNGGDANAQAGTGGNGGTGSSKDPGGDGGKGGDATAKPGKAGTGKTANGADGNVENEKGGNGGNGGDGCNEGKGGKGGKGNPPGEDGKDGKNLCVPVTVNGNQTSTNTNTNVNVNTNTNSNTNVNVNTNTSQGGTITVTPKKISQKHVIGVSSCPQSAGTVSISGPAGGTWFLSGVPAWLQMPQEGTFPGIVPISFTCQITNFTTHNEQTRIKVQGESPTGTALVDSFFDVFFEIELRSTGSQY